MESVLVKLPKPLDVQASTSLLAIGFKQSICNSRITVIGARKNGTV